MAEKLPVAPRQVPTLSPEGRVAAADEGAAPPSQGERDVGETAHAGAAPFTRLGVAGQQDEATFDSDVRVSGREVVRNQVEGVTGTGAPAGAVGAAAVSAAAVALICRALAAGKAAPMAQLGTPAATDSHLGAAAEGTRAAQGATLGSRHAASTGQLVRGRGGERAALVAAQLHEGSQPLASTGQGEAAPLVPAAPPQRVRRDDDGEQQPLQKRVRGGLSCPPFSRRRHEETRPRDADVLNPGAQHGPARTSGTASTAQRSGLSELARAAGDAWPGLPQAPATAASPEPEWEKWLPLWPLLLPFPRLPDGATVRGRQGHLRLRPRLLAHWARFCWCALFALAYFRCLGQRRDSSEFLAGEAQEVRDEFFPDAGKTGERLAESEVTPGFKVALHADDVAKTLVWLQMFCMEKAGSDDHIPWAWRCALGSVEIGKTHRAPWNIINNSRLNRGDNADDAARLLKHICRRNFLIKHIVFGDDPADVPFGDITALHKLLQKEVTNVSSVAVAEEFDECTVLSGNPMIEIVTDGAIASREAGAARIARRARSLSGQGGHEPLDENKGPHLPTWCYHSSFSVLRLVFLAIQANDLDYDGKLVHAECEYFLDYLNITDQSVRELVVERMDINGDGAVNYTEALLEFFRDRKDLIAHYTDTYLDPICRNHHWGLMHACGPEYINVNFHIEQAHTNADANGQHSKTSRNAYIDVNLHFTAKRRTGHKVTTGWYKAELDIEASICYGKLGGSMFFWGVVTLVLFISLFLSEVLCTLWRSPVVLWTLLVPAKRQEIVSLLDVRSLFATWIDGRGVRIRFMGPLLVILENLATVAFTIAVWYSISNSFEATVPRMGQISDECESVYEKKILTFAAQMHREKKGIAHDGSRLISPVEFITHCSEGDVYRLAALYYEILFDSTRVHGLALFLFLCRLLDVCMAFEGTAWIGYTVALGARKLWWFLVFYLLVICCFASIMEVSFGNNFLQFRSLPQSCLSLILFTFGQTENAFRGVQSMEEYHSFWVSIYMLVFAIMVVTVAMQFFVSFVLDAYNTVQDNMAHHEKNHEEFRNVYTSIATMFFPQALRDGRDYRRELRKPSSYHVWQLVVKVPSRSCARDAELQEPTRPARAASAPEALAHTSTSSSASAVSMTGMPAEAGGGGHSPLR
ncbi:unnamed protein product [Prorocentrum cordatum]|uniref:Ion transport domain-containing protein n=1 Tax=Prorocentrum cordatum TaxID=2364126 RepID=A0ABN9T042_9DINO|nr:unnamed protein product [Polarella glacialis]